MVCSTNMYDGLPQMISQLDNVSAATASKQHYAEQSFSKLSIAAAGRG